MRGGDANGTSRNYFGLRVPSIAMDLLESERFRNSDLGVEAIAYGGMSAPPQIPARLLKLRYPVSK